MLIVETTETDDNFPFLLRSDNRDARLLVPGAQRKGHWIRDGWSRVVSNSLLPVTNSGRQSRQHFSYECEGSDHYYYY